MRSLQAQFDPARSVSPWSSPHCCTLGNAGARLAMPFLYTVSSPKMIRSSRESACQRWMVVCTRQRRCCDNPHIRYTPYRRRTRFNSRNQPNADSWRLNNGGVLVQGCRLTIIGSAGASRIRSVHSRRGIHSPLPSFHFANAEQRIQRMKRTSREQPVVERTIRVRWARTTARSGRCGWPIALQKQYA